MDKRIYFYLTQYNLQSTETPEGFYFETLTGKTSQIIPKENVEAQLAWLEGYATGHEEGGKN